MRKLIFATNNTHKLSEIRHIMSGCDIEILSLSDINFFEEIAETCDTLEGNALQKAQFIYDRFQMPCFADDTGLEVNALNGAPGVYSARYAGEKCSYQDNVIKLLHEMNEKADRTACFKTVIAYIENGEHRFFNGELHGSILTEQRGKQGFEYDPVFMPTGYHQSYAEMEAPLKNSISHRYLAVKSFTDFLIINNHL